MLNLNAELPVTGINSAQTTHFMQRGIIVHDLLKWEEFEKKYVEQQQFLKKTFSLTDYDTDKDLAILKETAKLLKESNAVIDDSYFIRKRMDGGDKLLIEGGDGAMLDIDNGAYPYIYSYSTSITGTSNGLCIAPSTIDINIGVIKAYTTRIGEGPFLTEIKEEVLQEEEFKESGGKIRYGWMDMCSLRHAQRVNGYQVLAVTGLEVLSQFHRIKILRSYKVNGKKETSYTSHMSKDPNTIECDYKLFNGWKVDISKVKSFRELPDNARRYVRYIEANLKAPVAWLVIGDEIINITDN